MTSSRRGVVVFGGGSAANCLVNVFDELARRNRVSLSHVIPISDNGGSSSELMRCFGGPGIGDVRSTLLFYLILLDLEFFHPFTFLSLKNKNEFTYVGASVTSSIESAKRVACIGPQTLL